MGMHCAVPGVRTLLCSFPFIFLPIYASSLVLRDLLGNLTDAGLPHESFQSVPGAFFMIFRAIVANDDSDSKGRPVFLQLALHHGWVYGIFYICFVMCMSFGLFNVIVAIFVDNVLSAAKSNDQLKLKDRLSD